MKTTTFHVGTANIKGGLPDKSVRACVNLARRGLSVLSCQEMSSRDAGSYFPNGWRTVQYGGTGSRKETSISFDETVWRMATLVDFKITNPALAIDKGGTHMLRGIRVGSKSHIIASGTRQIIWVVLINLATGVPVAFVASHSVAHIDAGGKFGWTNKGALGHWSHLLPNPLIPVYKTWITTLMQVTMDLRSEGFRVVAMGDWNVGQQTDEVHNRLGTGEPMMPYFQMRDHDLLSIYMAGETKGTCGSRGIDVIAVGNQGQEGTAKILGSHVDASPWSDHNVPKAHIELTSTGLLSPPNSLGH